MRKIAAKYIFTLDSKEMQPLENGCVTVEDDGRIVEVGVAKAHSADIEYYDGVIAPGMVNAHCHIELSHLKGYFKEATGMSGFIDQINALRSCVGPKERRQAMEEEFKNFQRQGVVAVSDISNCNESFALKKKYLSGSKSVYYRTCTELFGSEPQDAEKVLQEGLKLSKEATSMGLEAAVTPHSCYTMSPKLLCMSALEGLKSGYISYHSEESPEEEDLIMYGRGPLYENYKNRGLSTPPVCGMTSLEYFIKCLKNLKNNELAYGKIKGRVNLVHNVAISQESITAAVEAFQEPYFTICPLSNIFIHRALPPLDLMRANHLKICLGTDSLSSNKILSMVEEIKCINANFPKIPLSEILEWACLNGANMLRLNDLGSITPGKKPGLVYFSEIDYAHNFALTSSSRSVRII